MALQFQLQQTPFRFGLAEGTDPHQATPGTLMTAENIVWKQSGRIEKRLGTTSLNTTIVGGGSVAAGSRLFCRGSELCLIDGTSLYAYATTAAAWRNIGSVSNVGVTTSSLVESPLGAQSSDVAVSAAGKLVHAWVAGDPIASGTPSGALFVQVYDSASGTVLLAPVQLAASLCFGVRVLTIGTTALVITRTGAASPYTIVAYTIDLSALTTSGPTTLRSDHSSAGTYNGFDACVIGSTFVLAYNKTGPTVALYSYNSSCVQQATGSIAGEASGAEMIGIDGASGESLYVIYKQGGGGNAPVRSAAANPSTLVQTVAPGTIETPGAGGIILGVSVCRYDATNCVAAYTIYASTAIDTVRTTTYKINNTGAVSSTSERGTWSTYMTSRPFMLGGKCYMAMLDNAIQDATTAYAWNSVLAEVQVSTKGGSSAFVPHRFLGTTDPLIGGFAAYGTPTSNFVAVSSTNAVGPSLFNSTPATVAINLKQGVRLLSVTVGASLPTDMWRTVSVGGEAYTSGGGLSVYDGRAVFDYGFARAPYLTGTTSAAGGSIAAGTYLYSATQEYRSTAGILHRSPTATAVTLAPAGATSTNTIAVRGYNLETKQNLTSLFGTSAPVQTIAPIYRTTMGGTTYQRLTFEPGYNTLAVDQTAASVTLSDTRADASIDGLSTALSTRPVLYTTGGILDDYAPPVSLTMFNHADRLWCLAPDQRTWWHSKAFGDDLGVAPGFHPNFRISFNETQTAGASMDDKAIFFSATGVAYMQGTGPAANGAGSDFSTPAKIQSDVGCTNARSVVSTPDGLMFLSARGIYLLTRGLELVWIGRNIKDTLASYPTVTSATLVAKHNQVRFTCNNAGGTADVVLVYDYIEKQWSVSKYTSAVVSYGCPIADACIWGGEWTFVTPTGQVLQENATTSATAYLDEGTWIPMKLETAWLSAAGPIAFQSVRTFSLHGTSYTDHDLTVSVGFDSDTSYPQTLTHAAQGAVTTVGVEECEVIIGTRRKCAAIRFKIQDAEPTTGTIGTGRGPAFDMMGIEVGVKSGFAGVPATKRG